MITAIATTISTIKTGKDLVSGLYSYLTNKKDPEAAAKVSEIQTLLFELQNSLIELGNENVELAGKIRVLQEQLDYRSKLIRRDAYYEFAQPVEGYGKGPFCLQCTDINGFPVSVPVSRNGHFSCSKCATSGWLAGKEAESDARTMAANAEHERRLRRERGFDY